MAWDTLESTKDWKLGDRVPRFQYSWEQAQFEKDHPESVIKKKVFRAGKRGTRLPISGGSDMGQSQTKAKG